MHKKLSITLSLIFTAALTAGIEARAERAVSRSRQAKAGTPTTTRPISRDRRVAARAPGSAQIRAEGRVPRAYKPWTVGVGIAGGFAQLNSNVASQQQSRDAQNYHRNAYGAVQAKFHGWRYLGADLEGFYGRGLSRNVAASDVFTGQTTTRERSLQQMGILGEVQGRLPWERRDLAIIPHAGVGFGWMQVNEGNVGSETSANDGASMRVSGLYATAGLEARITREISVAGDYARSLATSGSVETTAGGTQTSAPAGEARFDRIRAGAYYRITPPLTVGTQYIRRTLTTVTTGDQKTETSNQFLGSLMLSF